jgi:hypothetical protein
MVLELSGVNGPAGAVLDLGASSRLTLNAKISNYRGTTFVRGPAQFAGFHIMGETQADSKLTLVSNFDDLFNDIRANGRVVEHRELRPGG